MSFRISFKAATLLAAVTALVASGTAGGAQVTTGAAPAPLPVQHAVIVGGDSASASERTVSLTVTNARLGDALDELAARARVSIVYTDRVVPVNRRVTARLSNVPLSRALETLLLGTDIVARRTGDRITLVRDEAADSTTAEASVVWGEVRDTTSKMLVGANVVLSGDVVRSTTVNTNGYYAFQHLRAGVYRVQVRMIGYIPDERPVVVGDSQTVRVDFVLHARLERLDEVLVTATGNQRRVDIGNDIVKINADSVMKAAPVRTVTELLETRVPGLEVQHTSGVPGDPSRIRLRGLSSINRSNDPILVIDGIRMDISEGGNHNLAASTQAGNGSYLAPSRLDQIDPNSIESLEVFKGPSAAAMYGPDAANGVIVITTKRGHSGPTHWQASASQGTSSLPGSFPTGLYRWGHFVGGGGPVLCSRTQYNCTLDSLVKFQALNDSRYSPIGHGHDSQASITASGGSSALGYSFTGSFGQETGILRLPDYEAQRFQRLRGEAPPGWLEHPDNLTTWSASTHLSAQLASTASLDVSSILSSSNQQRSSLENAISQLEGQWIDPFSLDLYGLLSGFTERASSRSLTFSNAASMGWTPRPWLTGNAVVGLNLINRNDLSLVPQGLGRDPLDSAGHFGRGSANDLTTTAMVSATTFAPLPHGMRLTTAVGMNIAANATNSQIAQTYGIIGDQEPDVLNAQSSQQTSSTTTLGWFVQPSLAISPRLHVSPGFRIDGGSTSGSRARFNSLPKLDASWLVSDESFFPFRREVSQLRLRIAYGQAGVQPGLTDRVRTYRISNGLYADGTTDPGARLALQSFGNSKLRPERSVDLEGGFDLGLLDDRVSVIYTADDKVRKDAILTVQLAPSVAGFGAYNTNIGVVENIGTEITATIEPVRTRMLDLHVGINYSRNAGRLVSLAPGEKPITFDNGTRIVPGYPLFGLWVKPILGFADANRDGIIDSSEVVVGDSTVYVGEQAPKYHASFPISAALFGGRLSVFATIDYEHQFTQFNNTGGGFAGASPFAHAANDPSAPLSEQAAVAAFAVTPYGLVETVNALRFSSLSVNLGVPARYARFFGSSAMSIAVQGSNLGLHTNYRGIDPNVNAFASGDGFADTGQLPTPRIWRFSINLSN